MDLSHLACSKTLKILTMLEIKPPSAHRSASLKSSGWILLVLVLFSPLATIAQLAPNITATGQPYAANEVLVKLRPGAENAQIADAVQRAGLTVRKQIHTPAMKNHGESAVTLAHTRFSVPDAVQFLRNHPAVAWAQPNFIYTHQSTANDALYVDGSLWGMYGDATTPANAYGSQAGEAWAAGYTGSQTVYVGVVDEGIQYNHPDLAQNIWTNPGETGLDALGRDKATNGVDDDGDGYIDDVHGWNALNDNGNIYDPVNDDHGTHVSGTIGAAGNNALGVVGVTWNVTIISGKFLGANGGTTADAIQAIDYMTHLKQLGTNIVALNNSWGGGGFDQLLLDSIVRAAKQNILFMAAAGNGNAFGVAINTDSSPNYPSCYNTTSAAGYDSVISITALDSAGGKATWANYGATTVDLGAPGVGIYSTLPGGTYGSYSGTSMATPHVTGAAALYASTHLGSTALDIRNALLGSVLATASLSGKTVTGGRLDLSTVIAPPIPTIPAAPTGVNAAAGNNQVTLSWNAVSGATSYNVKRSLTPGGPYETNATASTSYVDSTAVNWTTYYYVVSAVNTVGEGANSSEVSAKPQPAPTVPAAPAGLTAVAVSRSQINLSWIDNSTDETGFKIERSQDGITFTQIGTVGSNVTAVANTGLSRRTTYYYRVRAYNAAGNSAYSNIASATTPKF